MPEIGYDSFANFASEAFNSIKKTMEPFLKRLENQNRSPVVAEAENKYVSALDEVAAALKASKKREIIEDLIIHLFDRSRAFVNILFKESEFDFSDQGKDKTRARLGQYQTKFIRAIADQETPLPAASNGFEQEIVNLRRHVAAATGKLDQLENRLSVLDSYVLNNTDPIVAKTKELDDAFEKGIAAIEDRQKEIDKLASAVGRTAVAGTYAGQALKEEQTADNLRAFAVILMMVVLGIAGYSFFEATKANFNLQSSLLRLAFALMLSVPAAYLARESNKHRMQQYQYLQTSLELHAISPFAATLPEETQHKLKEKMATKIFSKSDQSNVHDTYPINIHELAMAIVGAAGKLTRGRDEKIGGKEKKAKNDENDSD